MILHDITIFGGFVWLCTVACTWVVDGFVVYRETAECVGF